ncbi:hypothetical protein V6Z11_D08G213500 [Gossypium hirsutum]
MPRKSFFPPSQLVVESTSFFLPLKLAAVRIQTMRSSCSLNCYTEGTG